MVHAPLDRGAMREAADVLRGRHDFSAFCRDPGQYDSCRRHLFALEVHERGDFVDIDATADGFLWNMVRILVGTLVHVGLGKLDAEDVARALKEGDRRRVGPTVPPDGLVLLRVVYDD